MVNPTKATNAMEGFKRKNKEKNTKQLQDLNQRCSPHLEEIWFGGIIDLGLLLQSSKDQRVWVEGLGDLCVLRSCNNGGERGENVFKSSLLKVEDNPF